MSPVHPAPEGFGWAGLFSCVQGRIVRRECVLSAGMNYRVVTAALSGVVGTLAAVAVALGVTVGLAAAPNMVTSSTTIADQFGVSIVFGDVLPCGAASSDSLGCFTPITPDTIYVKPGLPADTERYVVLHEIGHATQLRLGLPFDECGADRFAQSLGSELGYYCPPQ